MKILRSFLEVTGVMVFILLVGTVGSLENNSISVGQALERAVYCFTYIFVAMTVHKNAPKVVRHLKRANRKHSI